MKLKNMTRAAIIAAIYVALTFISSAMGLASGAIQVRLSEVLTVLPAFTFSAIPGLTVGCLISNILTGCAVWDVVFGTVATFIGAFGTRLVAKKSTFAGCIPPIVSNAIIVPLVLKFTYGVPEVLPYLILTVALGEIISCGILGSVLINLLNKHKNIF